ncbi:MAG TPA: hypothetical protein DEH78_25260 [Solibacterales bacterium]|nr:hypothetical protein [Bryobacterales bacterium]
MKQNLDALKEEIQHYLETEGFVAFYGYPRQNETIPVVRWDTAQHPDYHPFLQAAKLVDVKLVVFHASEFTPDLVDEALEDLEDADLPREEKRTLERRLRDLRVYEGFTYALDLSFDYQGRMYLFELETEWYQEFNEVLDEIDAAAPEDEEDAGPLGGYFSNN